MQFKRRFGGWSAFVPLEQYLHRHWIYSEADTKALLDDPGRARCVNDHGEAASATDIGVAIGLIEQKLFSALQSRQDALYYLKLNPAGRFAEPAKAIVDGPLPSSTPHSWHAFISHSSKDKTIAGDLVQSLRDENLKAWIDSEQILPGDHIQSKIEEGLRRSRWILVCISRHLKGSEWCRREYGPALDREISTHQTKVIPLLIDGDATQDDFPELLRGKRYVLYPNSAGWQELVRRLRGEAPG